LELTNQLPVAEMLCRGLRSARVVRFAARIAQRRLGAARIPSRWRGVSTGAPQPSRGGASVGFESPLGDAPVDVVGRRPLQAVVGDWCGTFTDVYSIAPAAAMAEAFRRLGVPISAAQARAGMGARKDEHARGILMMPAVSEAWVRKNYYYSCRGTSESVAGALLAWRQHESWIAADVKTIMDAFRPLLHERLEHHQELIPGAAIAVRALRAKGLKIGLTTGLEREASELLRARAAEGPLRGLELDAVVASSPDVPGRPWPWMLFRVLEQLRVPTPRLALKVDDTPTGIAEGRNAGAWTCGISHTSSLMDIDSLEHWQKLSSGELEARARAARLRLFESGAHCVVDCVGSLPRVVDDINARLARGERP
jgi:phosphonoacetaldehyde hydrolase